MAKNCSADVSRVIDYIDSVNKSGDQQKIQDLKNMFGLGDLEFDDFAWYINLSNHPAFIGQRLIEILVLLSPQCGSGRIMNSTPDTRISFTSAITSRYAADIVILLRGSADGLFKERPSRRRQCP